MSQLPVINLATAHDGIITIPVSEQFRDTLSAVTLLVVKSKQTVSFDVNMQVSVTVTPDYFVSFEVATQNGPLNVNPNVSVQALTRGVVHSLVSFQLNEDRLTINIDGVSNKGDVVLSGKEVISTFVSMPADEQSTVDFASVSSEADERGNVFLVSESGATLTALKRDFERYDATVINEQNYPAVDFRTNISEFELVELIHIRCEGWEVRKLNIDDVGTADGGDGVLVVAENPEDYEDADDDDTDSEEDTDVSHVRQTYIDNRPSWVSEEFAAQNVDNWVVVAERDCTEEADIAIGRLPDLKLLHADSPDFETRCNELGDWYELWVGYKANQIRMSWLKRILERRKEVVDTLHDGFGKLRQQYIAKRPMWVSTQSAMELLTEWDKCSHSLGLDGADMVMGKYADEELLDVEHPDFDKRCTDLSEWHQYWLEINGRAE